MTRSALKIVLRLALLALFSWCAGCGEREPVQPAVAVTDGLIVTSTPVAAAIVRELAPEGVTIETVVPDGEYPMSWQADDGAVERLRRAELIVFHGTGPERWSRTLSLPTSRIHRMADAVRDRLILSEEEITHSHGVAGEHSHREPVFGVWFDPAMLRVQAERLAEAIIRIEPEHEAEVRANLAAFIDSLRPASDAVERVRAADAGAVLIADREGYAYLARAVGLELVEPDAASGAARRIWLHGDAGSERDDNSIRLDWPEPLAWPPDQGAFGENLRGRLEGLEAAVLAGE